MSAEEAKKQDTAVPEQQKQDEFIKKLEEDDEFEDFPEDDWEEPQNTDGKHDLWEESWEDHDDYKDNFIQRLRYVYSGASRPHADRLRS